MKIQNSFPHFGIKLSFHRTSLHTDCDDHKPGVKEYMRHFDIWTPLAGNLKWKKFCLWILISNVVFTSCYIIFKTIDIHSTNLFKHKLQIGNNTKSMQNNLSGPFEHQSRSIGLYDKYYGFHKGFGSYYHIE